MNIEFSTVVVASKDQISCELGGEAAILNLKEGFYYGLDEVGSAVWQMLAEPRRVSEIRDELLDLYEVDVEKCSADLIRLLDELRTRGLIQVLDEPAR